jgi:dihydroorotase
MNSKPVRIYTILITGVLLSLSTIIQAQTYDILLKGGHIIDPKNKINEKMDLAISQGKIARIAADISASSAKKVIDVKDLYITPGLVDIHVHVFAGTNKEQHYMNGPNSLPPDGFTLRSGVTTVVDAGSSGWRYFPVFKKNIIDQSKTRVLAFLNIVGDGMGANEQDSTDMSPVMAARFAEYYKNDCWI